MRKSENTVPHKQQHLQAEYYKILSQEILNYDDIIVLRLTDTKLKLFNILDTNSFFDKIKIHVKQIDNNDRKPSTGFRERIF